MDNFKGKKLLIIGGAFQHVKVVETAKAMGIITYVADFLDAKDAPAKQIADFAYQIDIFDIDALVELCKEKRIDGVLSCNLDVCQKPYQAVCERLGMPCFGTKKQFDILTDKTIFKKTCLEYGIDIIPEYTMEEVKADCNIEYPIFVKPTESSSSRGQTICYSKDTVPAAIEFAKSQSRSGEILIEKYMGDKEDIGVSGMMINSKLYVTRIGDRFLGSGHMNKSELVGVYPSRNSAVFENYVFKRLEKMLQGIGLKDAPVFFQGFVDGKTIRFYDPGLRFPGAECEKAYQQIHGINLTEAMVCFAMTGRIPTRFEVVRNKKVSGEVHSILMYLPIIPGKIAHIYGQKEVAEHPNVVAFGKQYSVGDTVGAHYNAKQRYGEIDMVCKDVQEMKEMIEWIYNTLIIENENGDNMMFSMFNPNRFDCYLENK